MLKKTIILICLSLTGLCQKTEISNVRVELSKNDPSLIIKYDLISKNPLDSLYVIIRGNNRKLSTRALSGDWGYRVSPNADNTIKWSFLDDGMTGRMSVDAEIRYHHMTLISGAGGKVKLIGLIGGLAGGVYSGVLAGKINKDISLYESMYDPSSDFAQQNLDVILNRINKNRKTFYLVSGISVGIVVTDLYFFKKAQKKLTRLKNL